MKFKHIIPFFILTLILAKSVSAATVDIICDESSSGSKCEVTSASDQLFDISNWAPGQTFSNTLTVINEDNNDDCNLKMKAKNVTANPDNFPNQIFTAIRANGKTPFVGGLDSDTNADSSKNMNDIFNASKVKFGKITKNGGTVTYEWFVTFDKNASNEYQRAKASFDFDLDFTCDHDSDDDDDEEPGIAGAETTATFIGGGIQGGAIQGATSPENAALVQGAATILEELKGTESCRNPKWLLLFFVVQVITILFAKKLITKSSLIIKIIGLVLLAVFPVLAYIYFCSKIYAMISLILSTIPFFLLLGTKKGSQSID